MNQTTQQQPLFSTGIQLDMSVGTLVKIIVTAVIIFLSYFIIRNIFNK